VTAIRDRQSDLDDRPVEVPWDDRPIVGSSRGLPWWAAVLVAFGLAVIGAWIDMERQNTLGKIYQGAYIVGCLVAVCWVRRRNLFGPMVQPPLVFAVTAIGAVVLALPGPLFSTGFKSLIFSVALPLTSNFPTMAITAAVTVAIGLVRLWRERDPNPRIRSTRAVRDRDRDSLGLLDGPDARAVVGVDQGEIPPRRPRDRQRPDAGPQRRPARPDADRLANPGAPRQRTQRGDRTRMDSPPPRKGRREPPPDRGRDEPLADRDRQRPDRGDRPRSGNQDPRRRPNRDEPPRRQPRRRPPDEY
jgi:hypothetical protein